MKKRLLVNATMLNNPELSGLGIYTANLLPPVIREMSEASELDEIVLLGDANRLVSVLGEAAGAPGVRLRTIATNHPLRRLIQLNRAARAERTAGASTVFYSPTHHGVLLGDPAQIITVHDLFARLFLKNYPMQSRYFRWYMPRLLRRTSQVIVNSESTAADLRRFYAYAPAAEVIYLGVRGDITETRLRPVPSLHKVPYFLFIGPSYSYKNCERLIDAFAAYKRAGASPEKLVFVGGRESYRKVLRRHLNSARVEVAEEVVFLDYATSEELAWLYRNATALMITTLYEGFGLPALEAMACDCPVVASRAGSLPEVCGQAAILVDPKVVEEIAGAMSRLTRDADTRQRLIEAGRSNWRRFRWDRAASQVCQVIRKVLAKPHE